MRKITMNSLDLVRIRERIKGVRYQNVYTMREIEKLQNELNCARVLKPHQTPGNIITMNSVVTVEYLTTGKKFTIRLVYPEQADVKQNRVSVFAPIGAALLGYQKGDTIHWHAPGGKIKIRVNDVIYQPEAAGNYDL